MQRYKQLNRHDPEHGVWGDCYRTALACLLEVPPERVPHFFSTTGNSPPPRCPRCNAHMSWFSILQVGAKYVWVLYAGNNHEVLRSARGYNQPQHARSAARRLHRIVGRADFNYSVGFKGRTSRRVAA